MGNDYCQQIGPLACRFATISDLKCMLWYYFNMFVLLLRSFNPFLPYLSRAEIKCLWKGLARVICLEKMQSYCVDWRRLEKASNFLPQSSCRQQKCVNIYKVNLDDVNQVIIWNCTIVNNLFKLWLNIQSTDFVMYLLIWNRIQN